MAASKDDSPKRETPLTLLFDYWDHEGQRQSAGTVIKVSVEEAKRLLGEKKAERADPLPGED